MIGTPFCVFTQESEKSLGTKRLKKQTFDFIITDAMEYDAREAGIKLEYVNGIPIWEALPVYSH